MNMRHAKISAMMAAGILALAASPAIALAAPQQQQQQSQSAADAAKKAKEQQKTAPKAQTVWTNDSVGSIQGNVNVLGQQSSAAGASGAAADAKSGAATAISVAAPAAAPQDLTQLQSQFADAKKDLASAKADLDLAQRKYDLDAAQYYGTPNYAANKQGQANLDGEKSTIATKKQAADAAQKKVDDLTSRIKSLGGKVEEAPARPTTPQS